MHRATLILTLAVAAASAVDPAALLDPFPSLRGVGDAVYTSVSNVIINKTGNGTAAAVKAAISDESHAIGSALHTATDNVGNATLAKFYAIDAAQYAAWKSKNSSCNPAARKPQPDAYAFLGSGFLLPYYQGVVQGLQDRGVLTAEVMKTAQFAGFSGGSLTVVLTGLGWSGRRQYALFNDVVAAIGKCKAAALSAPNPQAAASKCTLNNAGIGIIAAALAGTNVPAAINKRVSIWACQVNAMATTLDGGVTEGTDKWSSNDDVLANVMVSDQIPCFTTDTFYNLFRGAPYIDGGYCTDFAQLCPKGAAKCLKMSTEFLGPALPAGTPFPTDANCPIVNPPNYLPVVAKPYYTPGDRASWKLPQGSCLSQADRTAINLHPRHVPQGVTAKPDIHPAFYAPLPPEFTDGCAWITAALEPSPAPTLQATFDAEFNHGYASAVGWADAHGYCA